MSDVILFADDTSMFNVLFDTDISAEVLNQRSEGCARLGISVENEFQP